MRVLHAMSGAKHGGAEKAFCDLTVALHEAGQPQRLVIRSDPSRRALLREAGLTPVELPFLGRYDLYTAHRLKAEIRAFGPDVILTWMKRATELVGRSRVPRVARLDGYYKLKYYRHVDHLVGVTEDIAAYAVSAGWDPKRVHYIPNFVRPVEFPPVTRGRFGTPEDVPVVLAMGRLHPVKGFDILVAAMERVPGAHLWLAGDGPLRQEIEDQIARSGAADRIRLLGWREDITSLLDAADVFVCPSRYEPFGLVTIEAWSRKTPVVATASQGPAGLIDDGRTGLLTPIDDADALAGAIARLLAAPDLRLEISEQAHAEYLAHYTVECAVANYRSLFQQVTAGR